ncbi:MAG: hotdog domain-containing protein [Fervidicoccaceae archaeon]
MEKEKRSHRESFVVGKEHLASRIGSGDVEVLSTPSLIAFMEKVSKDLAGKLVEEGKTTVGVHLDIYHVAPAYEGDAVEVESRIVNTAGNRIVFYVQAECRGKIIGYGVHERAVVDSRKFSK